jgi:ring-1,2-phenylacetyl-CoA epoxidase subunit PaaE
MNKYFLNVVDIRRETPEACTICFKQPGLRKIKHIAGQYITLNFRINENTIT